MIKGMDEYIKQIISYAITGSTNGMSVDLTKYRTSGEMEYPSPPGLLQIKQILIEGENDGEPFLITSRYFKMMDKYYYCVSTDMEYPEDESKNFNFVI